MIGSLKHLTSSRELTNEEERKALILGWCVEWVSPMWCVCFGNLNNPRPCNHLTVSASSFLSCGRRHHGPVQDKERAAMLVPQGN